MSDLDLPEPARSDHPPLSRRHLAEFCDYTSAMLQAGLTLLQSLDECALCHDGSVVGRFSARIALALRSGSSFSEALRGGPSRLPRLFAQLASAGERSGSLDAALREAAELLREDDRARATLLGASAYPAVVVTALLAFLLVLELVVIPGSGLSAAGISAGVAVRLAALQRTAFAEATGIALAVALLPAAASLLVRVRGGDGSFAAAADCVLQRAPLFGKLLAARELRLFAVALQSFAAQSVSVEEALYEASDLVGGVALRSSLRAAAERIEAGTPAAQALAAEPLIPERLRRTVALAERTGSLSEALPALTEHYRWETAHRLRRLEQLAEPLLIAFCGCVVLVVVLTVVLPLLSLFGEAL